MAAAGILALGDCIRLYSTSGAGFSSSGNGTAITGWTDDSTSGVNATNESNTPTHAATPPAPMVGPAAQYADESDNGFDLGAPDLSGGEWTFVCALYASGLSGFRNIFSSGGGADEGSLYTNGGVLYYQESGTQEPSGITLVTGEVYTIAFHASATRYYLEVRDDEGTLVGSHTFETFGTPVGDPPVGVPGDQPASLKIHTYGGSGAGWFGYGSVYALFDADKIANSAALHSLALEEAIGSSGIDGAIAETGLLGGDSATGDIERDGAIAETGLLGTDSMAGSIPETVDGTIAETGLLGSDSAVGDIERDGAIAETGLLGTDSATIEGETTTAAIGETGLLGGDSLDGSNSFDDNFEGSGALQGWYAFQPERLPGISQTNGRYLAEVDDNTGDITLWFNGNTGAGHFRFMAPGTEIIVRNIGIGVSPADTQTAPPTTGDPYAFGGLHFNEDLSNPTNFSAHIVAGHRGGVFRTIETKVTTSGVSAVADEGFNALGATIARCDMRAYLDPAGFLYIYYRAPNSSDPWIEAAWPGARPQFASGCQAGIIPYAAGTTGLPFVVTADSVHEVRPVNGAIAETGLLGTDSASADIERDGAIAETGLLGSDSATGDIERDGAIAETGLLGTDSMVGDLPVVGAIAETGLLGTDSAEGTVARVGAIAEMGLLGGDAAVGTLTARGMTLPVIAGEALKLHRRPLQGGAVRLTIESPTLTAAHPVGRRSVEFTPPSSGEHNLIIRGGTSSALRTIEAVAEPSPWPTFSVAFLGDSITVANQAHVLKGFVGRFGDDIGANVTLLGTQSTTWDSTSYAHDGAAGDGWEQFDSPAQVLQDGGGFNLVAYETALGARPDVMFINLGTEDALDSIAAGRSVTEHTDKAKGHIDSVIGGITAAWNNVDIVLCTSLPGAFFQTDQQRAFVYAYNRMLLAEYASGQVAQVHVLPVHLCVDPHVGYPSTDTWHPNDATHQAVADMHRWWCAARVR